MVAVHGSADSCAISRGAGATWSSRRERPVAERPAATRGARTRRTRLAAVAVLTSLLAGVAALAPRPVDAATAAPAASGWYVTSRENASGIELMTIRRDHDLARGHVAVVPRSALYRLRTVLASEQLIGGTGRDITTNLCARVHCHAAVNGDRWDLVGHDAGRLTGAVATGGELVATQPLPPADPYGHLLIGRDGSMEGTIQFPIPLEPEVAAGELALAVDVNRQPMPDRTSVITRRYSPESRTPPGTVEYILSAVGGSQDQRVLTPLDRREGSGPIPDSSLVVAANGRDAIARADAWWAEALAANRATFNTGLNGYREVIGGSPLLLQNGAYGFPTGDGDGRQPRTVIGWDATRVWLVTVDGRRSGWSGGLTYVETAQMMRWLGATDALNLDGGGSTSFVGFGDLRNWPSGDTQRAVAAAVVIMPPENRVAPPPPARTLDPACPPGRFPTNPFPDVAGSVHSSAIACMAWWDVTAGSAAGTYEPLRPVRRDQMAAFLARYLYRSGVPLPANPPDAFRDDDRSVHEPWINALAAIDVIGGRGEGRYAPSGEVTRGQMASFLARAIPLATQAPLPNTADYFADDSGDVHEPNINKIAEGQIAGGTTDGRYRAGASVRRDQMASFLARALSVSVEAGKATPPG